LNNEVYRWVERLSIMTSFDDAKWIGISRISLDPICPNGPVTSIFIISP